jgi:esterase/lipase superfamily enzyme
MGRFLRRMLAAVVLLAVAVSAYFIFYHPPMRLMPPPLLFREGGLPLSEIGPALAEGSEITVFFGSSRLPVGPREARIYTVAPDWRLHLGEGTMRIGEEGSTMDQIVEWTTQAGSDDRPFIHLQQMNEFASVGLDAAGTGEAGPEAQVWYDAVNQALAESRSNRVLVYVHGANTTVERGMGQGAMLRHFTGRNAVVVVFVWPTAENFLRYSRDIAAAYGAAPRLTELIGLLAAHTTADKIDVFTYSAGATVGTDALALLAEGSPEVAGKIGEVYHAAPDADFRGFVDDLALYAPYADRVTAAVNLGDSALRLAAAVNRGSRAGRPDIAELTPEAADFLFGAAEAQGLEILRVRPENMEGMSSTSHTFWYDDPWVSNDALVTLLFRLTPVERGLEPGVTEAGAAYWTFPPDYPDRVPALRDLLLPRLGL